MHKGTTLSPNCLMPQMDIRALSNELLRKLAELDLKILAAH